MLDTINRIIDTLTWRTSQVAQVALFFAMGIIVAHVILREFWKPVPGVVEMVEMSGAILLGLGVAYTASRKGHIAVGVLVERFSPRIQAVVDIVVNAIALFFTGLLTREIFSYATRMMDQGYISAVLELPMAPAIYLVAFGFLMMALVIFGQLLIAVATVLFPGRNLYGEGCESR